MFMTDITPYLKDPKRMSPARRALLEDGAEPIGDGNFAGYLRRVVGKMVQILEPVGEWGREGYGVRHRIPLAKA